MKFEPYLWMNDTMVLSAEARGCWINLICLMWNAPQRGEWTGTYEEFARVTGTPWENASGIINELSKVATVAHLDKIVTLKCRRIVKEDLIWKNKLKREGRYRERRARDAKVTHQTLDVQDVRRSRLKTTTTKRVFVHPSTSEVTAYGASIGYRIDGAAFCDFYESKGWKVGNTPMKSWQAAVRTWKRRPQAVEVTVTPPLPPPKVYAEIPESERMTPDEMKMIREKAMGGLNARAKEIV
jgi:uncharacterized protein YdaU (DUF1376 family)